MIVGFPFSQAFLSAWIEIPVAVEALRKEDNSLNLVSLSLDIRNKKLLSLMVRGLEHLRHNVSNSLKKYQILRKILLKNYQKISFIRTKINFW